MFKSKRSYPVAIVIPFMFDRPDIEAYRNKLRNEMGLRSTVLVNVKGKIVRSEDE